MWIKIIITFITLLLLFDEYFKVVDKVKKRNKRKIILTSLAVLSVLSLIDVIKEVNDGNALVQKANKIIIQSDTLLSNTNSIIRGLGKNIQSINKTGESIVKIDSVLINIRDSISNQVEVLQNVVNQSRELVQFEKLKFKQDEARIVLYNTDILLAKNKTDSTLFSIKFKVINTGIRKAIDINFSSKILYYNNNLDYFLSPNDFGKFYFLEDLSNKSKGGYTINSNLSKEYIINNFNTIIFIFKCEYKDSITKKSISYKRCFIANQLFFDKINFYLLNNIDLSKKINKELIKNKYDDFLINLTFN
jgi:hypothetical protein